MLKFQNSNVVYVLIDVVLIIILVTIPRGDIVIEYGTGVPLEITCVLDPDNEKVRNLYRNHTADGGEAYTPSQRILFYKNAERVSRQYMTIINSTAAQLRIPNPPAGRDTFYCTLLLDDPLLPSHDNSSDAQLSTQSSDLSTFPTQPPTSLETSGPPSLVSQASEVGVCLNSVAVGCELLICLFSGWYLCIASKFYQQLFIIKIVVNCIITRVLRAKINFI